MRGAGVCGDPVCMGFCAAEKRALDLSQKAKKR